MATTPARQAKNRPYFVSPNESAKSLIVAQLVRLARKERLDYATFLYVCRQARRKLGLRKPPQERRLPPRAHGAEWRAPEHRSREAQRAACRSAAGWRSRQPLEAASAESEGP